MKDNDFMTRKEFNEITEYNNGKIIKALTYAREQRHDLYVRTNLLLACVTILALALVLEVCCG